MPCKVCKSDFNMFNWKFKCGECSDKYCKRCLRNLDGVLYCERCHTLLKRPPDRNKLMELKPKDLQEYLQKHNIPTRGLVEKQELVDLLCSKPIPVRPRKGAERFTANFAGSVPNLKTSAFNDFIGNIESTIFQSNSSTTSTTIPTTSSTYQPPRPPPREPPPYPTSPPRHPHPYNPPPSPGQHSTQSFTFATNVGHSGWRVSPEEAVPPQEAPTAPPEERTPPEERASGGERLRRGNSTGNIPTATETTESGESMEGRNSGTYTPSNTSSQSPAVTRSNLQKIKLSDFGSAEELHNLSSKQLKALLELNRVNYKGCVEKSELIERVERLWNDTQKYTKEDLPDDINELCKLCMDAPLDCVLLECGHIATCINCGKKLAECPICRQYVSRVVRTFKA